ncbi:hypothetical protein [Paenibacillus campi]|uniref:hypothetical protein n=1 Tax=Paenibacillus campi TaxID=3106031 RepID=UPI002B000773|nr:hypothetical protein [Paenibacillus sp. SGZ-1014]
MGNVIAFWGARPGQTGNSSNLVAAAAMLALDYVSIVLAGHTQYGGSLVESAFRRQQRTLDAMSIAYCSSGIDSLERMARAGQLTASTLKDYTLPVFSSSLDLLPGTHKPDADLFVRMHEVAAPICQAARSAYDLTLIDAGSGHGHALNEAVLHHADLIVVSLSQNMSLLCEFFERMPAQVEQKRYVLVIGQYDSGSRLTLANIRRLFKPQAPMFVLPHCSSYMDACNEQKVVEFFLKRKHIQREQPDYALIQHIRSLNKGLFTALGVDPNMFAKEA